MLIQNNSLTRSYTVGLVNIQPGKQADVLPDFYDDVSGIADLQVISGIPADGGKYVATVPALIKSDASAIVSQNGLFIPAFYGRNICIMGDSITQQNTFVGSGSLNFLQHGSVVNALAYLGRPWEFQPSDNFAVFGSTLDAIIANQLPTMLLSHATQKYSRCFLSCGTNDTGGGAFTLDQIKANYSTLFSALRANGIIPVHMGVRPRGADVANTNPKLQNVALNEWLFQQSLSGRIEFIDCTAVYADNSTAFGNMLQPMCYDWATSKLHPSGLGAMLEGKAIADYYIALGIVPNMKLATQQNDIFDRINNPSGVAFNNANPLLQGGTTAPTGMSTTGGTWSITNRTLPNGQTRTDRSCALAASTLHHLYDDWVASGNWSASQLQSGDIMEARAKVVVTSGVNIQNIQLRASVSDGTTVTSHYDLGAEVPASLVPDGNHTLWLKTPRFVVPAYSGSGNALIYARVECQTGGTGSGTFLVQALELRKVG